MLLSLLLQSTVFFDKILVKGIDNYYILVVWQKTKEEWRLIVEDTKDLVEAADYVIIEAVLVDDGLRYKQLSVGIKNSDGDIIRIVPISTTM